MESDEDKTKTIIESYKKMVTKNFTIDNLNNCEKVFKLLINRQRLKNNLISYGLRELFKENHPRELIIESHLLIENILDELIKHNFKNSKNLIEFGFIKKLEIAHSSELINTSDYSDIVLLNKLRNKFAHDFFFNYMDFSFNKFTSFRWISDLDSSNKKLKQQFYLLTLKIIILSLIIKICDPSIYIKIKINESGIKRVNDPLYDYNLKSRLQKKFSE